MSIDETSIDKAKKKSISAEKTLDMSGKTGTAKGGNVPEKPSVSKKDVSKVTATVKKAGSLKKGTSAEGTKAVEKTNAPKAAEVVEKTDNLKKGTAAERTKAVEKTNAPKAAEAGEKTDSLKKVTAAKRTKATEKTSTAGRKETVNAKKRVVAEKYRTFSLKPANVEKKWFLIDAKNLVLGRLASQVAKILRGKTKITYTPHVDCGRQCDYYKR